MIGREKRDRAKRRHRMNCTLYTTYVHYMNVSCTTHTCAGGQSRLRLLLPLPRGGLGKLEMVLQSEMTRSNKK